MKNNLNLLAALALLFPACAASPRPENTAAVAGHMGRMAATDMAIGTAAALDPTGLSGIPAAHLKKKLMEESHEKMVDDSLSSLPPDQRELMKKHMKGQISEEEFKKELFGQYGLDADGNPLPPKS